MTLPVPDGRIGALTAEIADRLRDLRTLEENARAIVGRMHRHSCPECYEAEPCEQACGIEPDLSSKGWDYGSHVLCGNCARRQLAALKETP